MALIPLNMQSPPELRGTLKGWEAVSNWIGVTFRRWTDATTKSHAGAITQLGLAHNVVTPSYGATVTIDLSLGAIQKIVVTNGNPFTIAAPINITQLASWQLSIVNASGGAMGTVTFNPAIHQAGFSAPANGFRTSTQFYIDTSAGPAHYQIGGWSSGV